MPCRRSCGNSWSYSWSTQQPVVQYYYPAQAKAEAPQVQQASSAGRKTEGSSKSSRKSSPIGPGDFEGDYHEYGTYLHNWYRRRHGSPPVAMLDRLNKAGDAYCAKLAAMRTLMHSSGLDYNENLFMSFDTSISKKEAVRQACKCWYDEIKLYSFSSPGFSMSTGHFTAMVWKEVTQFGMGCWEGNGCIVVAGCYKPHANMQGQFSSNVLPYREVHDTEDEESDNEPEEKTQKPLENVEPSKPIKSQESPSETSKDDIPPAAKNDFAELADSDGTIGWEKLNDWLNKCIKVSFKFDGFDKLVTTLLISLATIPSGEKQRINLTEFGVILECVEGLLNAYDTFDRDGSGTLDPFELKDSLAEAGFNISYKMFLTLNATLGDGDKMLMSFRSFLLTFLLLSKLQAIQLVRDKNKPQGGLVEDFSLKGWIQLHIEI